MSAPIALALDAPDLETALAWAQAVDGQLSTLKIGLELYLRDGAPGVAKIRAAAPNCRLFLDLKLHDIPNTVAGACRSVGALRPDFLTVHALGGGAMVAEAAAALPETKVAAVTVLTSMGEAELTEVGLGSAAAAAIRLGKLATSAGARALVCSPQEVGALRLAVGPEITLITPGVRLRASAAGDQRRIATPKEALAAGADLLVIGRPITDGWVTGGRPGLVQALGNVLDHLRS